MAHVNDLLAEAACPRRIVECATDADWHVFLARTPQELDELTTAGILRILT